MPKNVAPDAARDFIAAQLAELIVERCADAGKSPSQLRGDVAGPIGAFYDENRDLRAEYARRPSLIKALDKVRLAK